MKIYTKGGDKGETSLASGRRIQKFNSLIEAYGTVDELNAFIGDLMSKCHILLINDELARIQYLLFNIGSILARDGVESDSYPALEVANIAELEQWIDQYTEVLEPMTAFILPSGSQTIAKAHICRTVCRRAERRVLSIEGEINNHDLLIIYLNRLSDYFFTLARYFATIEGVEEYLWNAEKED
ncbi:MAG: cob(I)alamin adenosyltransferase [Saprospiraceae bacterium]|jgi:cob(I)alamin adenosyltransferase